VNLGLLCGRAALWERLPLVLSAWGLASSPFDCWLASRGLGTFALRCERACANAREIALQVALEPKVSAAHYPGLEGHPDHEVARRQFGEWFGSMVTFTLEGGTPAAERFICAVAEQIPFSPSLGDLSTTLSHPESTSHRNLTPEARAALGIFGGTIRLSVGIESVDSIQRALCDGFRGV
jgi:cystathionine beta-lyase/cystathionine gamma-synthase